jgi:hypothetical protein
METKTCSRCGEEKSLERFPKASWIKCGYLAHCKDCDNKRKRESEARIKAVDPEAWDKRRRKYVKTYKEKHPERVQEQERRRNLRDNYGITIEEYDALLEKQDGKCVGCLVSPTNKRFAVDHDHSCCPGRKSCGRCVRGLLCSSCNTALGLLKENEDTIARLLVYMKDSN